MTVPLTLEYLLQLNGHLKLRAEPVPVPELGEGCEAWIAELSADERDARLEVPWLKHKERTGQGDEAGFRAFVAAACWCSGPDREFIAADCAQIEKVAAILGCKDSKPITRMFAKAAELNALTGDQIEEVKKN